MAFTLTQSKRTRTPVEDFGVTLSITALKTRGKTTEFNRCVESIARHVKALLVAHIITPMPYLIFFSSFNLLPVSMYVCVGVMFAAG